MSKKINIAIVGATGIVGETLLQILAERDFPVGDLFALASEKSVGNTVLFKEKPIFIQAIAAFDFSKAHIAFFAAGNEVSLQYAPIAAQAGCIVIDKSSAFRYDKDVPLVVPEVNPEALKKLSKNIIANPNCATIPIAVAMKPIYDAFGIKRMNIATYQSVSGAGKKGVAALAKETADLLSGKPIDTFALNKQIAFNVIPKIDAFHENGYTLEEMKLVWETQKIFNDKKIQVNPTAVRVPVFFGHSASVHIETKTFPDAHLVSQLLAKTVGVEVINHDDYPTPVTNAANHDMVFVGRIRNDISIKNGINLWVVVDNVRKGAALNAVQIAELLVQNSVYRH
ncbi:MAG: aspartate-semialdehyde dehydrogenase [Gammaproteobacteria bacterium CG_4_10_14_0_8_um_filter_38_16]|nr:MAG: aspartate-semialdehyde dehydrogenase [Gammaproteobacteria bacterium CG_4_10_14_0_8_um_filter_38_16]PJA04035.1 MAG: aspartate-semialdehyde dehydrogenase [Gammaproteobacteria bacterium CG_4_10_14_0_2_um_filter_38_22]PJB10494.1 MAG: aspartate-semialdehyde dehydrogenase [Gammaproteobacteria bacterium CG_4_9_14_3_um_filter_38_9]